MTEGLKLSLDFKRKFSPQTWRTISCFYEDSCSQSHTCAGRLMGIQVPVRDKVLKPPSYDPRDIVALLEKYGDAHISDSGWRPVDQEEWYSDG